MISPKLKILERQLNRASVAGAVVPENAASSFMASYKAECDRLSNAAVKAAEAGRTAAEEEVVSLLAEISRLRTVISQTQDSVAQKVDDSKAAYKQEMEATCSKHKGEMGQMQSQIDALRGQVATERQDKVRALAEKEAAQTACNKLEQQVTKLQDVKPAPVAVQKAPVPKSFTTKITQRDESGRMVSVETIPHY